MQDNTVSPSQPMFCGPVLLDVGDAVSTTRDIGPCKWEPATFCGYVLSRPRKVDNGYYRVELDTGTFDFRNTQTLAIWGA